MHPDQKADPPPSGPSRWLLLLLVGAAIVLFIVAVRRPPAASVGTSHEGVNQPLKAMPLSPLIHASEPITLDDMRGNVVLVNYWGPWCPPCLVELPELLQLEAKYRQRDDVKFLLVSSSGGSGQSLDELRADTLPILKKHQVELPIYHDESDAAKRILIDSARLNGFSFPTTVVLDREGIIRGVWIGYQPTAAKEMKDVIDQALAASEMSAK